MEYLFAVLSQSETTVLMLLIRLIASLSVNLKYEAMFNAKLKSNELSFSDILSFKPMPCRSGFMS